MGSQGIYTHTVAYERDAHCAICGAGVALQVQPSMTLQQVRARGEGVVGGRARARVRACGSVLGRTLLAAFCTSPLSPYHKNHGGPWPTNTQVLDKIMEPSALGEGRQLAGPSLSLGSAHLFARGIYEEETTPNLAKPIGQLVGARRACAARAACPRMRAAGRMAPGLLLGINPMVPT